MKKAHSSINEQLPVFILFSLGCRISVPAPTAKSKYQVMTIINQIDPFRFSASPGNVYVEIKKMIKFNLIATEMIDANHVGSTLLTATTTGISHYKERLQDWAHSAQEPSDIPALLTLLSYENRLNIITPYLKAIKINLISDQNLGVEGSSKSQRRPKIGANNIAPTLYRQKSVQACLEVVLEFERHLLGSQNQSSE